MRIIAGEHRGRRLEPPPGDTTRPITDRAKQSLFDVLAPYLPGAEVADVFAGTGSMGLESLSRGATRAAFFEADRTVLAALGRNIAALRLESRCTVHPGDLFKLFAATCPPATLDIVFLDPPYRFLTEKPDLLIRLAAEIGSALKPEGLVSFRHDASDQLALPPLVSRRVLTFGTMAIELLTLA